jgi:uncharacterized protein YbjQ (UPF0145 family)
MISGMLGFPREKSLCVEQKRRITTFSQFFMLLTTTSVIDGKNVAEYLGIVTGETIIGVNVFRDFMASIRDFVGGRTKSYEKVMGETRQTALQELEAAAEKLGADAVIGIDIDYEVLGQRNGMLMVSVSGTAVRLS